MDLLVDGRVKVYDICGAGCEVVFDGVKPYAQGFKAQEVIQLIPESDGGLELLLAIFVRLRAPIRKNWFRRIAVLIRSLVHEIRHHVCMDIIADFKHVPFFWSDGKFSEANYAVGILVAEDAGKHGKGFCLTY